MGTIVGRELLVGSDVRTPEGESEGSADCCVEGVIVGPPLGLDDRDATVGTPVGVDDGALLREASNVGAGDEEGIELFAWTTVGAGDEEGNALIVGTTVGIGDEEGSALIVGANVDKASSPVGDIVRLSTSRVGTAV